MKNIIPVALLSIGLSSVLFAAPPKSYAPISFGASSSGTSTISPDDVVKLVIESDGISYESARIPEASIVSFVNALLDEKAVSYVGVYVREGAKFGATMHHLDLLRLTKAKNIGVSPSELPVGREI